MAMRFAGTLSPAEVLNVWRGARLTRMTPNALTQRVDAAPNMEAALRRLNADMAAHPMRLPIVDKGDMAGRIERGMRLAEAAADDLHEHDGGPRNAA
jgi:hypothetical protein